MSPKRITIRSNLPPIKPDILPILIPIIDIAKISISAIPIVVWVPYNNLEYIHLPILSVPKGYISFASIKIFEKSVVKGLFGAKYGASIEHIVIKNTII